MTTSYLYSIVIGKDVTNMSWLEPANCSNLVQLSSNAMTPPSIGRFTDNQYENLIVYVPTEGKENYENDANWAFFQNMDTLDINTSDVNIQLFPEEATIAVGETLEMAYDINPWVYTYLTMNISDTNVLSMPEFGVITGQAPGTAEVSVKLLLNGKTATSKITVIQPATKITLNKTSLSLDPGQTANLFANVSPVDVTNASVTWTSSNVDVATVEDGKVTAIAGGECDITATTHNGLTAVCHVKVKGILVESIRLDITEAEMYIGQDLQLTATVLPENATDKSVIWTSDNEDVATVDQNGLVTVLAPGYAVITATAADDSNVFASCYIACVETSVEAVFSKNGTADVYTLSGILLRKGVARCDLDALTPGVYILRSADKTLKVTIAK